MKKSILLIASVFLFGCKENPNPNSVEPRADKGITTKLSKTLNPEFVSISTDQANLLAKIELECLQTKFPYHLNTVVTSEESLKLPTEIHGAFLGCQSWESSIRALWMLTNLVKQFPEIELSQSVMTTLENRLTKENIQKEIAYFKNNTNTIDENPYAWAWLLKLSTEIHNWRIPMAQEFDQNLMPLANLMQEKIKKYLDELSLPIRSGNEENTAYILNLAFDYAKISEKTEFLEYIKKKASNFYLSDNVAPVVWEPSGKDFLSPSLAEVGLMSNVLSEAAFRLWIEEYMPQLKNTDYKLEAIIPSDKFPQPWFRTLNYNRARVFYSLANKFPSYEHLRNTGDAHVGDSFSKILNTKTDTDLRVAALYALNVRKEQHE